MVNLCLAFDSFNDVTMRSKVSNLVLAGCLLVASPGSLLAAPVVTMQVNFVGGFWSLDYEALDFYYTPSPGAEFSNYRLLVFTTNGNFIEDPFPTQRDRQGDSTAENSKEGVVDTYMNTVWSYAGKESDGANATILFNAYNPHGTAAPVNLIDWSVFDSLSGDGASVTNFDGTTFTAPYKLARVLIGNPDAQWQTRFDAYDTQSAGIPTYFYFIGPELDGPVYASHSTIDALAGDSIAHLFKMAYPGGPPNLVTWSNFNFSGPGTLNPPVFDDSTHEFNWNSAGSALGTYEASVKVTNYTGFYSDTATLTIHLVPEPATLSLFGLALVGAIGFIRRR